MHIKVACLSEMSTQFVFESFYFLLFLYTMNQTKKNYAAYGRYDCI